MKFAFATAILKIETLRVRRHFARVLARLDFADSIGSVVFPMDTMDSIGLISNPSRISKYCLHFRLHLITRLPVTQVDSTVLPISFFDQTPLDSRFSPVESD